MKHASSLPEWQKNVVEFLSSRRKYRLFGWEFGPILFDELYRIRDYRTDYIRVGAFFTPIVAFSAGLVSFVSTRRVYLAAVVTSSLIVLGIITTLAVDYQMTKRKAGVVSQEDCVKLLKALERMPQYWWWPWSKQIEDITITEEQINRAVNYNDYSIASRLIYSLFTNVALHQLYVARLSYLYSYHKLGGKMVLGFDIIGSCKKLLQSNNLISSDEKVPETAQEAYREENRLEEASRIDKLVRTICRVDNKELSLSQALDLLQKKWMPFYLDKSLGGVRKKTKSEEEHNKYFESLIKQFRNLSLKHHPDKGKVKDEEMQKIINQTTKALRNIHSYIIQDETFILNKDCYLLYGIYNRIPLSTLSSDEKDISRVVKVSSIDGMSALFELSRLADQEEEFLMRARNRYLKDAKASVEFLCEKLLAIKNITYKEIESLSNVIEVRWKEFDSAYNGYVEEYYKRWVDYLESLNARCEKSELLEVIKEAVEKFLKESKEQYEMLVGQSYGVNPDENFVLPMLDYFTLMEAYYKFATKLLKDKKNCYSLQGYRFDSDALDKISSILKESKDSKEVLKEKSKEEVEGESSHEERIEKKNQLSYKDNIKEDKLSYRELLFHTRAMVNSYVKNDDNELNEEVKRSYKESKVGKVPTKEEIGNVIVFMLKRLEELLSNRFQSKKTAFQRQREESKQLKEEREKSEEELRQAKHKAELTEEVSDLFTKRLSDFNMDSKLGKAILKDQRKIKRKIVKCIMEYNFSLEQVLGAIMEGIKFNEERVVREGAVSDELIEVVIRNFLTINEIVEEMVEKVVIEVDNSTVLQDMQAPSSVFNNVTNEPIAGPSCRR
ncbi:J domain-containing protein [Wolbachia endosymbiont (group A) of Epistrophe grossularia]|uniref:J domain-containing protein n=1 Tax=Wolbachia endosymbiont (group A) of Epistrophe grossularia TaxID=2954008 RepID=UPI002231CD0D|nr:J domain-containing protein [Wolbachia endosymbiont (group A) of Epistrophe grossularia]